MLSRRPIMQDFEEIVRNATELEALPGSALRLTSIMANEDWVIDDIVDTISHDQALTGRLLSLANSAASGSSQRIGTVGEAVMRVGTGPVLSLALATAVRDEFGKSTPTFGASEGVLWHHSVASALAMSKIAPHCGRTPPSEAFVAALLHDVGFLVLDRYVQSFEDGAARDAVAGRVRDLDHGLLGGLIATQWRLTGPIEQAITHHHTPTDTSDVDGLVAASFVAVADCVAHRIGVGFGPDTNKLDIKTTTLLQITREHFAALCDETEQGLEEFLALYS